MRSFKKNWKDRFGKKQGYWEFYYHPDGSLSSKGSYKDDRLNGMWGWYYPNGNLQSKGLYKNGILEGIFECYDEDGGLKWKKLYEDGDFIKVL
jgi:antitoxin component YwqK of YwqJK toxin-antitoxin module